MIGIILTVVGFIFKAIRGSQSEDTARVVAAIQANTETRKANTSLIAWWAFTFFFLCTAGTSGLWYAAIVTDTMFSSIDWGVPNPPKPYDSMARDIILQTLGVGIPTAGGLALGGVAYSIARMFRR